MTSKHGSKLVVVAAHSGNLAIAIPKFIAASTTHPFGLGRELHFWSFSVARTSTRPLRT